MTAISTETTVPAPISTDTTVAASISEDELEARYMALVKSRKVAEEAQDLVASIQKLQEAHALLVQEAETLRRTALGIVS